MSELKLRPRKSILADNQSAFRPKSESIYT